VQGRHGWLLEAKRQLDQDRWRDATGVPRSRSSRIREAGLRLEDELEAERRGNLAYEEYRAHGMMKNGRRLGHPPKPVVVEPVSGPPVWLPDWSLGPPGPSVSELGASAGVSDPDVASVAEPVSGPPV